MSQHHQRQPQTSSSSSASNNGENSSITHPPGFLPRVLPFPRVPVAASTMVRPNAMHQPSFAFPLNRPSSSSSNIGHGHGHVHGNGHGHAFGHAFGHGHGFGLGHGLASSQGNNPRSSIGITTTPSNNRFGSYFSYPPSFHPVAQRTQTSQMARERENFGESETDKELDETVEEKVKRLEEVISSLRQEVEAINSRVGYQEMDIEWYRDNTDILEKELEKSRKAEKDSQLVISRQASQIAVLNGSAVVELTLIPPPIIANRYNSPSDMNIIYGTAGGHDQDAQNEELEEHQVFQGDNRDFILHEMVPGQINDRESVRLATIHDINRLRARFGDSISDIH